MSTKVFCALFCRRLEVTNHIIGKEKTLWVLKLDTRVITKLDRVRKSRNNEVTENQLVPLGVYSEYRNQVLYEMRKPYNREEYYQLKHDVQVRKPIERHMDLRNGRERSYSFNKYGKSLLDHYPGLVSQYTISQKQISI